MTFHRSFQPHGEVELSTALSCALPAPRLHLTPSLYCLQVHPAALAAVPLHRTAPALHAEPDVVVLQPHEDNAPAGERNHLHSGRPWDCALVQQAAQGCVCVGGFHMWHGARRATGGANVGTVLSLPFAQAAGLCCRRYLALPLLMDVRTRGLVHFSRLDS